MRNNPRKWILQWVCQSVRLISRMYRNPELAYQGTIITDFQDLGHLHSTNYERIKGFPVIWYDKCWAKLFRSYSCCHHYNILGIFVHPLLSCKLPLVGSQLAFGRSLLCTRPFPRGLCSINVQQHIWWRRQIHCLERCALWEARCLGNHGMAADNNWLEDAIWEILCHTRSPA